MTQLSDHAAFDKAASAILRDAVNQQIAAEMMILRILSMVPAEVCIKALPRVVQSVAMMQKQQEK